VTAQGSMSFCALFGGDKVENRLIDNRGAINGQKHSLYFRIAEIALDVARGNFGAESEASCGYGQSGWVSLRAVAGAEG
jgi:hypothetical protein